MTVIAWDGKTLAADKIICFGNTKGTVTKIFRVFDCLVGTCGTLSLGLELLEWFRDGAEPKEFPASNRDTEKYASLIVVRPGGIVWKYEMSPIPFRVEGPFCAFGCGDESALIAMELGCDARRAVELVIKYNICCGNGIDVLELKR